MNETPTPAPHPGSEDRLKKIHAAQEEMEAMNPSPEQIAYEQLLETHAEQQATAAGLKAEIVDLKTTIPREVAELLKEDREKNSTARDASETRIINGVVAELTPKLSNRKVIDRINFWGAVLTGILVAGIGILIFLFGRR